MKRRGFTLLEILISISIAGILFGVLFSKIREFASLRKEVKRVEAESLERQTFQIRLQELFTMLVSSKNQEESYSPLYTKQNNLFFQIQQPIDVDPSFVNILDCTVQFDAALGHLFLTMKNNSGVERKEILSQGISNCKMRFFNAKEKIWVDEWSRTSSEIPVFLSIICKKSFGEVEYLFPIDVPNISFSP